MGLGFKVAHLVAHHNGRQMVLLLVAACAFQCRSCVKPYDGILTQSAWLARALSLLCLQLLGITGGREDRDP